MPELRQHEVSNDQLIRHYMYLEEYTRVFADDLYLGGEELNLSVIDLGGLKLSQMTADLRSMIKSSLHVAAKHYPGRTYRLLIINIPSWFSVVGSIVKSTFTETQQKKSQDSPM